MQGAVVLLNISLCNVEVGRLHLWEQKFLRAWGLIAATVLPECLHVLFLEFVGVPTFLDRFKLIAILGLVRLDGSWVMIGSWDIVPEVVAALSSIIAQLPKLLCDVMLLNWQVTQINCLFLDGQHVLRSLLRQQWLVLASSQNFRSSCDFQRCFCLVNLSYGTLSILVIPSLPSICLFPGHWSLVRIKGIFKKVPLCIRLLDCLPLKLLYSFVRLNTFIRFQIIFVKMKFYFDHFCYALLFVGSWRRRILVAKWRRELRMHNDIFI